MLGLCPFINRVLHPQGPLNATAPYIEDHTPATTLPPAGAGRTTGAIFAGPRTISRTTATPAVMPHSVLPTVSDHCTPRFGGKQQLPRPHSCTPPLLVTIKGGGGLPLGSLIFGMPGSLWFSHSENAQTLPDVIHHHLRSGIPIRHVQPLF